MAIFRRRLDPARAGATLVGGYSVSPGGAHRLLDLSLPVAGWPAYYAAKPSTAWANTAIDVEMTRHYAGLAAYVAIPPVMASLNDQTTSTVLLP